MCLDFLYYLYCGCIRNEYEDISINLEFDNPFDEAIHITQINEPDLIIRYKKEGIIMFNKHWFFWFNHLQEQAFNFMNRFKPPQFDYTKSQLVYICNIPEKYHEEFLQVIKKEYNF